MTSLIDVAIPTMDRATPLSITLSSLLAQSFGNFRVLISDQSEGKTALDFDEIRALKRIFQLGKKAFSLKSNLPRKGMAEQRQFLLDQVSAPYVLFLDDDLFLENKVVERLLNCIEEEECGFVGAAVVGLTYLREERPHEQNIEFWQGPVLPETVKPGSREWQRYRLHNAANLLHVKRRYINDSSNYLRYKVAWVGGCVLYDTEKLRDIGGFEFWKDLPRNHCGEDVLAQLRVMARYGGCGVLPSGVYHQEVPTTLPDRSINAPEVLPLEIDDSSEEQRPNGCLQAALRKHENGEEMKWKD